MLRVRIATLFLVLGLFFGGGALAIAQDATPSAEEAVLPAEVHTGTCDAIGDMVVALEDVQLAPADTAATPPAEPTMAHANVVLTSVTTLDQTIDELLSGDHVIVVYAGADQMDTVVACAQIEGQARLHLRSDAPPGLVISMQEVDNSGYAGVAWLSPADNGGTTVTLFIAEGLIGQGPC